MKLFIVLCLLSFLSLVAGRVAPVQPRQDLVGLTNSTSKLALASGAGIVTVAASPDAIWEKARCQGAALLQAMILKEAESKTLLQWPYTQSPWDGDLKDSLRKWGYLDDEDTHAQNDVFCDFSYRCPTAFAAMGIDTQSAGKGGPNHCFKLEHRDSPAVHLDKDGNMPLPSEQWYSVDGKIYRITNAMARIGINRNDGVVYFLHRNSPEEAAGALWGIPREEINKDDLPAIRSSSDLAWGLWNRIPGDLQKIKMIMSMSIANDDINDVIFPRAMAAMGLEDEDLPQWPGIDFTVGADGEEGEAAKALIGSPNGLGAGYFLFQHKRQLGGANFIYKVKIFQGDDDYEPDPNIIFFVEKKVPHSLSGGGLAIRASKVLRRSGDGRHVIREHVL